MKKRICFIISYSIKTRFLLQKIQLKSDYDYGFVLVAITSTLRGYSLCHKINTSLELEFEKVEDHQIYSKANQTEINFALFRAEFHDNEACGYLVSNRNSQGVLISEMHNVDFFMILQHFYDKEWLSRILKTLNGFNEIQVATLVDPLKLKSKENLLI